MIESTLGLFFSMALLAFLLLAICIYIEWGWKRKIGIIMLSVVILINGYFSLVGILGWPTPFNKLEQVNILVSAVIQEPEKTIKKEGAIYLWVKSNKNNTVPRSLRFAYSRKLHQVVIDGMIKNAQGVIQGVKPHQAAQSQGTNGSFMLYDFPNPLLKPKGPLTNQSNRKQHL